MEQVMLFVIAGLSLVTVVLVYVFRQKTSADPLQQKVIELNSILTRLEQNLREDFRNNREESSTLAKAGREEISQNQKTFILEQKLAFEGLDKNQKELTIKMIEQLEKVTSKTQEKLSEMLDRSLGESKQMREDLEKAFRGFQDSFEKNVASFNQLQREKFVQLEQKQNDMILNTEAKLNLIKATVEEKLEKTLSERLGQSFETVGKQLIEVQKGLGEMQVLAQDVGGLKKVLSNVKMRGGIGEVQLGMLLDQILAPEQFQANVKTKDGSADLVEFAIKLPGRGQSGKPVWLPIDAKFPKDIYETLLDAYDKGDLTVIEQAQRSLDATVKKFAKDISDKYLDPPNTTDFGIMFLPFEGIFAEVVRKSALLEDLQRNHKIIVTGPTTLASILNSLQMGFKTLAIEKRSSEVWQVLGAVKKEFESFGGLMQKAQGNIQTGLNQLDDVMGVRTRAIQKRLKAVETLGEAELKLLQSESLGSELSQLED